MKLTLVLFTMLIMTNSDYDHSTEVDGIRFSWVFKDARLHCSVFAPGPGWVAVGFNVDEGLTGTNLIMGAVEEDFYTIDDRYIVAPGDHRNVLELGVSEKIENRKAHENKVGTTINFSMPQNSSDKYHYDLIEGRYYYLLLAYSMEDDFGHHSIKRKTIKIKL